MKTQAMDVTLTSHEAHTLYLQRTRNGAMHALPKKPGQFSREALLDGLLGFLFGRSRQLRYQPALARVRRQPTQHQ